MPEQTPQPDSPQQHLSGCFTRLCWMMFGNVGLLIVALFITKKHGTWLSVADILFWAVVAILLVVRYADIKWFGGYTAVGNQPATMRHWTRYAMILIAAALGLWLLAHLVPRLW